MTWGHSNTPTLQHWTYRLHLLARGSTSSSRPRRTVNLSTRTPHYYSLHTGVVCSLLVWGCWLIIMSVYDWLASLGFGGEMLVNSKLCEILPADDQSDNICLPPTPLLQPLD